RELERGLLHLDRELRGGEAGGVHDIGPMDQLGQRRGVELEALGADLGEKLGAGGAIRIVELLAAAVLAEMLGVGRGQEGAEMVVEPPGDARIGAVLEVHDGVVVARELGRIEQRIGLVAEAAVLEFGLAASAAVELGEDRRRGRAVEAMVVEKDPDSSQLLLLRAQVKDPLAWAGPRPKSSARAIQPVGKHFAA